LAIAVVGLVGLGINARVKRITERALQYDVELEDRGDDFRVAVLDMRHYHRNLVFAGPTRRGVADYEAAYLQLHLRIDDLDRLPIEDAPILHAGTLRNMAERYYQAFHPAIVLYASDPQAFTTASDHGLIVLAELESAAREIDQLGETRAAASLRGVEAAADSAQWVLLVVLAGLILVGVGLAYLIVRNSRERQAAASELAHALQLKNDFIADASHELRTPLTVLRANAEVALELERDCVHTELLEEIVQESERMTHLVEDLLFLARSDAGSVPLVLETVELEPFWAELAERARLLAQQQGVQLRHQLTVQGAVAMDRARIEQAVLILVDNATKYSPDGKLVTMHAQRVRQEFMIEVADEGIGIPMDELPFIFERFYRVDKARSRKQGGAGLGLAIAKSIMTAHGGRVEAASQLNQGTQMRLFLPLPLAAQPLFAPVPPLARESSA
jgi:signal transduction histidine kinase